MNVKALEQKVQDMRNLELRLQQATQAKERSVRAMEDQMRQGLKTVHSAKDMKSNFDHSLPQHLVPGNVGDYYRTIWPFWFTLNKPVVPPNQSKTVFFTNTQEAAFIWTSVVKSVFKKIATSGNSASPVFIDDSDPTDAGDADGLFIDIRDSQSRRQFNRDPININHLSSVYYPTDLESPQLLLPKTSLEVTFFNENPNITYIPWITFNGFRLRIENAQEILSTVYG